MNYKSIDELSFPWTFNELISLPGFMIEEIYRKLDEDIEEIKKARIIAKNKANLN